MFVSSMLVAVLAAISSVQAIPTPQPSVTVSQSIVTTSSVSVTTSQAATITSQAFATTPRSSNTTASVTTPGPGPIRGPSSEEAIIRQQRHPPNRRILRQLTVFDFNNQAPAAGAKGGSILLATVDNFPILEELGISGAISFVQSCGLNIPHTHPRASQFIFVVEGSSLGTYQGTAFPMGSIHYQQNPTCSPAVFVAALNNEDPGRSDITKY
ncbi:spherulin-1B precursor [Mycena galericulata]|nr:spherulin-1B precursor [Mycena galericulata]